MGHMNSLKKVQVLSNLAPLVETAKFTVSSQSKEILNTNTILCLVKSKIQTITLCYINLLLTFLRLSMSKCKEVQSSRCSSDEKIKVGGKMNIS